MKIVGIIGKLNTGKDTVAEVCQKQGYVRHSFADPVKEIVHEMFNVPRNILWGDSSKRTGEVRRMLQGLGTDYARSIRPNIWVSKMQEQLRKCEEQNCYGVVIPDVRFLNEAEMLHERGATLIYLTRPLSGSHETDDANYHLSETENILIPREWITHTITNNRSLCDLQNTVQRIIGGIE
jgi:hypothetical protein